MRKQLVASLGLSLSLIAPATSGAQQVTGNVLLDLCESEETYVACGHYIVGALDALQATIVDLYGIDSLICIPPGVVTRKQQVDIVITYLRENPEERHLSALPSIINAISGTFPCDSAE